MQPHTRLLNLLACALVLPVVTMFVAKAAVASRNAPARPQGPCDIYAAGGTPCVAAHSTTRALSAAYNGPLYQVRRESDGKALDIGLAAPTATDAGDHADAAAQDAFCANTLCVITRIYDQSGKGNHLYQAPPGTFLGPAQGGFDTLPIADMAPISIGGHKAYGVFIMPGMGLRNNDATGLAIGDEPEGIYYVIDGTHYSSGCCFDYGNASTNGRAVGTGTMETTYFGTATAWGKGAGPGPWIMADMEAGLFSGYNAKENVGSPTVDSWRFVTAVVDGGGGNQWDLRGGNAQSGGLTTFYSGPRPGTPGSSAYFPMSKKGGILLGNGGDNGNGSAGTFYEGVITTGYPNEATTDAVQANIVATKYDVPQVRLSRVPTFTPGAFQYVDVTFTNITTEPVTGVSLRLALPSDWGAIVTGMGTDEALTALGGTPTEAIFRTPVAPGKSVRAAFGIRSPMTTGAGYLTAKAEWTSATDSGARNESTTARVRNVPPVKLNEVLLGSGTSQFIELHNAGSTEVDISKWSLVSTASQWAPVKLATIPTGTRLAPRGFYLLGLASSGLAAPTAAGATVINVRNAEGFAAGQDITVGEETVRIAAVGTSAAAMTTVFIPVSTGPWLTFPAGSTNLPVTSAAGFEVGQKIGIDLGGNYEVATVTAVGKASTQATLSVEAAKGATNITVAGVANISAGDTLTVDTGGRKELVTVKAVLATVGGGAAPAGGRGAGRGGRGGGGVQGIVELAAPLKLDHMFGVDVSDPGTGISFTPATKFAHTSGDAVQALGSGLALERQLAEAHPHGTPVLNPQAASAAYSGQPAPHQWFGRALATGAGSLALMDASGAVVVDAMVYGSQQRSSSADGTIASPELATLVSEQTKGGNIVVVPAGGRGGRGRGAPVGTPAPSRSLARVSDGTDTGSLATDFQSQVPSPGAPNGSVAVTATAPAAISPGAQ
jgi:hypothetical protein